MKDFIVKESVIILCTCISFLQASACGKEWKSMFKISTCLNKTIPEIHQNRNLTMFDHISCMGECSRQEDCIGANFITQQQLCILIAGTFDLRCHTLSNSYGSIYYDKRACVNGGLQNDDGTCDCINNFFGTYCEIENPCLNGGMFDGEICNCSYPYVGQFCEKKNVCHNNGTEDPDGFCICTSGFCGEKCEKLSEDDFSCQNGGCLINGFCSCTRGYYGSECSLIIKDCKEGHDLNMWPEQDNIFVVKPSASYKKFKIKCGMSNNGNTILQSRASSGEYVNFNRSLSEYEEGFGDLSGNYWIGLKKMYYLTQISPSKSFYVSINDKMMQYTQFDLSNALNGYKITVDGKGWDNGLEDIMQSTNGYKFSTYDQGYGNCSRDGGWWFAPTCTNCYLNIPFPKTQGSSNHCIQKNIQTTLMWFYYP